MAGQGWLRASESHPAGASLLLRRHSPPALALPHSEVRALMNTPSRSHRIPGRPTRLAALAVAVVLLAAGCSAFGGDDGSEDSDGAGGAGGMKVARIAHGGEGDAIWDLVRKGAEGAPAKD